MDEKDFGILLYWTRAPGIGGKIKQKMEDFVVEEMPLEFTEGDAFTALFVEKRGLDTFETTQRIAKALGLKRRAVAYAGMKDRYAITKQWFSVPGRANIEKIEESGLRVLEHRPIGEPIHLGELAGNRFAVTIRGIKISLRETDERLRVLINEIEQRGIPNFFGPQRFGANRPVTHRVGRKIIKGDFDGAVFDYLALDFEGETEDARSARRRLAGEKDYKRALEYFPRGMAYERMLLTVLAEGGGSIQALRALPLGLAKLFIDAYQSYIFNLALSRFLEGKETITNFPAHVTGYKTSLGKGEFDHCVRKVLEEESVTEEDFFVQKMPELAQKGAIRSAMIYPKIAFSTASGSATLRFELKKGSYATTVIREITKD
ncbi:MAG: tRNA pseudouridine(13) synthase TruD [Candidatus Aenigmatarchaeota archaeon]|nr:MAG: tRNA pseudouridine(13) synthase TruD [Candidatus Aenigmarchaeota archaeon]